MVTDRSGFELSKTRLLLLMKAYCLFAGSLVSRFRFFHRVKFFSTHSHDILGNSSSQDEGWHRLVITPLVTIPDTMYHLPPVN